MWNSLCIATHRRCFSSVGIATDLIAGSSGFDAWWKQEIFSFLRLSRPTLESSQPPSKRVPWLLIFGRKTAGPGFDHRPRLSTDIKNGWSYTSTSPSAPSWLITYRFLISFYCHAFFILLCYLILVQHNKLFPSRLPNKLLLQFLSIALALCVTHNALIEMIKKLED